MIEVQKVAKAEQKNYEVSCRSLGESLCLADDIKNLYTELSAFISKYGATTRDDIVTTAQFILACQYNLTVGTLTLLRGHVNDSFVYTRKAIEYCAFALKIKNHPHLAKTWVNATTDEASYKTYREKFSPGKIFTKDHETLSNLYERYDICSKLSHPSLYSMSRHLDIKSDDSDFTIGFNYFQLSEDDPSEPARTFFWIIDTHFHILKVFEEILQMEIKIDPKIWQLKFATLEGKLLFHKAKWKEIVATYL